MYPVALHKTPTQTVDSSQVFGKCIRQKQPQIIKSIAKNWDENKIKDPEKVCPKQHHNFPQRFDRQRQFCPNWNYQCDQASSFERSKIPNWVQ